MMDDFDRTVSFRAGVQGGMYGGTQGGSDGARITLFDGTHGPVTFDLTAFQKSVITFGRDAGNDIILKSHFVSKRHGQFRLVNGMCIVEDLGSTNGLYINGMRIKSYGLRDNVAIRIDDRTGSTVDGVLMVFSAKSSAESWNSIDLRSKPSVVIGRKEGCDIHLNHVSVSKVHAQIHSENGRYVIVDNNSTNGVWVNGRRISGKCPLNEKDVIMITNSKLIYSAARINYCTFNRGISVTASHIVKTVDKGRKTICEDVSLKIEPCELVAIIGGSGAGKSTIMNCISGYNKPTSGEVRVNGVELYNNFDALKNIMGYVPQKDIVYENLTVYDMLDYTAKLRLPKDTSEQERNEIIMKVIDTVELTQRKDTLIKKLSGGQKKRASIAVELISDPNLFFLDEPASGLDPGTERNLMRTLKSMTVKGKTVIFVTHSTLNLHMCDKIVFMGTGGKLCFCGSYQEALDFFGVTDMVDVYNLISEHADYWQKKYNSTAKPTGQTQPPASQNRSSTKPPLMHQIKVLAARHLHILKNDRVRLMLLLLQAPILGLLISFVADGSQFEQLEMTKSLLFALSCSAFWVGTLNSIQEICKERVILRREYMTGLRLDSYILSKLLVMGLICMVQATLLTLVFIITVGLPDEGVALPAVLEIFLAIFLTAFAATAMGLFVSSLFKNADRAMTVAPLLLMPQLLFSGLLFKLSGATEAVSWLVACRFSMEGLGTTANLNSLESKMEQEFQKNERMYNMILFEDDNFFDHVEDFFDYEAGHFFFAMFMLVLFVVVFSALAGVVLRSIKNDRS